MIQKILISIFIILMFSGINAQANDIEMEYNEHIRNAQKYQTMNFDIVEDTADFRGFLKKTTELASKTIIGDISVNIKKITLIIFVCIITSLSATISDTKSIKEATKYGCVILCGLCYFPEYNSLMNSGINAVRDLSDYMSISFPGVITLMAGSGYESSAIVMNSVFVLTSGIISLTVSKIVFPVIYSVMLLTLSNGVCNSEQINKIIKAVIKFLKYLIGITLTIFCAVLTLTGLASTSKDTLAIKTVKYAASNFVPIVGGCLSETLNSIIHSSSLLKSSIGCLGTIVIIIICVVPVIKIFFMVFVTKILSIASALLSNEILSNMLDLISEILNIIGAILVLFAIIFIIMFGIAATIGG